MTRAEFQIRPARRGEAGRLSEIAQAAKASWGYEPDMLQVWRDDLTIREDQLDSGVWVAEVAAEPAGWIALWDASIEHLWVDPRAMGWGIGSALLRRALAEARGLGIRIVRVESDPNAEDFYRRAGAARVGEIPSTPAPRVLPVLEFRL